MRAIHRRARVADLVRVFHNVFGCMVGVTDTWQAREDRNVLHREEHAELVNVLNSDEPLERVAKELADVVYVCYGTALALGIDLDHAVELVHASNMSKLGNDGRPILRDDGKVLKGPHYFEPDMHPAVAQWQEMLDRAKRPYPDTHMSTERIDETTGKPVRMRVQTALGLDGEVEQAVHCGDYNAPDHGRVVNSVFDMPRHYADPADLLDATPTGVCGETGPPIYLTSRERDVTCAACVAKRTTESERDTP